MGEQTTPTHECRVGTNKCFWCGNIEHFIAACPQWMKTANVGATRPPPLPRHGPVAALRQGPPLPYRQGPTAWPHQRLPRTRSTPIGRAYVMSKKEATTFSIVVTSTFFLNSMPFCVLLDSGTMHSFISTWFTLQLDLEHARIEANYRIKLSYDCIVDCPVLYKHVPISLGESIFPEDLIQFDLSDFDIILRIN